MIRRFLDSVFIREWRRALSMWSVRLAILLGMAAEGWGLLSVEEQQAILDLVPDHIEEHVLLIFSVALLVLRLKRQGISE